MAPGTAIGAEQPVNVPLAGLRECLETVLPTGLDPIVVGRNMRIAQPGRCTIGDCLAMARAGQAGGWSWVAGQVRDDFAAGNLIALDGWHLARTEAWLCAALAGDA